ncbi:MAG: thiamine phosphate synthase [Candidatus Sumerlaeaceae bacterium]
MNSHALSAGQLRLYLVTDDRGRSPGELERIVSQALQGGVTAVQFREKCAAPSFCVKAFARLSAICREHAAPLLLNADLLGRFELLHEPDGVHFSERTLPLHAHEVARLAGYSAHNLEEASHAVEHGVDFCTLSPIFETPSKAGLLPPLGLEALREARRASPQLTIVALGGIDETNAAGCIRAGASGIAVMRAIMNSDDPLDAARRLSTVIYETLEQLSKGFT